MNTQDVANTTKLWDVRLVARALHCSARHVCRLSDSGRIPPPVKVGALVRWRRDDIERWIQDGCPDRDRQEKAGRTNL